MAGAAPFGPGPGLLAFAASAVVTAALTWAWIGWARRRNVMDAPGHRRLHASATPRGGGVGMAVVLVLAALVPIYIDLPGNWPAIALGLGLVAATGLADDLWPTPTLAKLAGQVAAAAAIAWALPWPGLGGPGAFVLSFAWTLVLVNFWNFMDGANGIVALQTLVIALALAWLLGSAPAAGLAWVAAAACLGFLPFNLPRARVFMGDTGSHVLGATIAILTLSALREAEANLGQVLLMLSAFVLDAGLTLAKRIAQGRRFWQAHREHLYQWAVRRGHSHARICMAYAGWAILCSWIALGWSARGATEAAVAALAVGLAGAATWVVLRRHWLRRDTRMDAST